MTAESRHSEFDVMIVGGGNAGISAAARLIRRGITDVAVVEPQSVHTYRPLLSYVGGGQATLDDAERTQRSVTPDGCTWLQDSVAAVEPHDRRLTCASGRTYGYRDLILAPGLVPDTDALPHIDAAMEHAEVTSNYLGHADKTWRLVHAMPAGGRAVFTVPRSPVSCTGTTIKPLFLAAAHWRLTGRLAGAQITLVIDRPAFLGVAELDARLQNGLDELRVDVLHDTAVTALQPENREIAISGPDGAIRHLPYDLLHLVPPFRGPRWLQESGLTGAAAHGLIDIDPGTLRHRMHDGIWAAGDGAAVDTDPSGGALRRQISILVDNLLAARRGHSLSAYDGYTVAPITTDDRHLIPGEFDRSGAVSSSLPRWLDPLKPRRSAWAFDRYGLPQVYWHRIVKGRL
jgi:sulfide:quinone oxidoreductase